MNFRYCRRRTEAYMPVERKRASNDKAHEMCQFIRLNNDTIKYLQRENTRTRIATVDANKSWWKCHLNNFSLFTSGQRRTASCFVCPVIRFFDNTTKKTIAQNNKTSNRWIKLFCWTVQLKITIWNIRKKNGNKSLKIMFFILRWIGFGIFVFFFKWKFEDCSVMKESQLISYLLVEFFIVLNTRAHRIDIGIQMYIFSQPKMASKLRDLSFSWVLEQLSEKKLMFNMFAVASVSTASDAAHNSKNHFACIRECNSSDSACTEQQKKKQIPRKSIKFNRMLQFTQISTRHQKCSPVS